jgi:prepilin-type N-terminal cleavage/methylation domain-containing protein
MIIKNRTQPVESLLRRAAFTLMEMLVVVAIIVVLAGVGGAYLIGQLNESKISAAKAQARVISQQIEVYTVDHNGNLPPSLDVLLQRDQDGKGPYLKTPEALKDPYGNPYQYDPSGSRNAARGAVVVIPDVFCLIPDGSGREVGNFK